MSQVIINWEKKQIIKNEILINFIKLINYSKLIFSSDHKMSFAINKFVTKQKFYYESCEKDLVIDYFTNSNSKILSCEKIMSVHQDFFNNTIFIILKKFHSLMISKNNYLNVYYKKNIINIYLESHPMTSVFEISNLKNWPFNYNEEQITIIKQAMFFLKKQMKKKNGKMIKLWNLYFFLTYKNGKAVAIDNDFLMKINDSIKNDDLIIESINYDAIINNLLKD